MAKADTYNRTFTSSTSDGYTRGLNANYATAHDAVSGTVYSSYYVTVGQGKSGSDYIIFRSYVYFDTSIIPADAVIDNAVLSLRAMSSSSPPYFNVTIQNGQPTYPHDPIQSGDYYYNWYSSSGNGGSANTSTIADAGYWNITLNSNGKSWIQKEGATKLCLRSSRDINSDVPTGNEFESFYDRERGESYAAILYVTYSILPCTYNVYGPYLDTPLGAVYTGYVNVTVYPNYDTSQSFILDGTEGADSELIAYDQPPIFMTWNISSSTNETRVFYFTSATSEDIYIFIPSSELPYYLYTFTVTDMRGVTNGYLETQLYLNGENRVVERRRIDAINPIPFYLQWALKYDLRIVCAQGTLNLGSFTPLTEQNTNLLIPFDAFPISYAGMNVACIARRLNSTFIQMNYSDWASTTIWVHTAITHKQGVNTITDSSDNSSGSIVRVDWNDADTETDYIVTVTAFRAGSIDSYVFSCPHIPSKENPWSMLDVLDDGTFPIQPRYLAGFALVVVMTLIFSYAHIVAGGISTVAFTAFFTYIGWLDVPWIFISVGGAIVVLIAIAEFKKTEREI